MYHMSMATKKRKVKMDWKAWASECRSARKEFGLSVREAANLIGMSKSILEKVELGVTEPKLSVAIDISDFYGVEINGEGRVYVANKDPYLMQIRKEIQLEKRYSRNNTIVKALYPHSKDKSA